MPLQEIKPRPDNCADITPWSDEDRKQIDLIKQALREFHEEQKKDSNGYD